MNAVYIFQQIINGLSIGSIYAVTAVGYTMVYGILKLINFAHGEVMMIGAYAGLLLGLNLFLPFWLALIISIAVACLFGLAIERLAYKPLRGAGENTVLLSSLAVSMLLQNLVIMIFSPQPKTFLLPDYLIRPFVGDVITSPLFFITISFVVVCAILLTLFIKKTKIGIAMRACSENLTAARLMGINVDMVITVTFLIGAGLAGISGFILAGQYGKLEYNMGFVPGLKAFVACVVGGIGNIYGALVGGILVGLAEMLVIGLLPPMFSGYRDAFVFVLLILLLLIKPSGIFGSVEGKDKVK